MSSKRKYDTSSFRFLFLRLLYIACLLTIVVFCFIPINSFSQIIDRIVALVDEQVITLTDLKIAEAFGLYEDELAEESEKRLLRLLERIINQKIVITATSEDIIIEEEEIEAELKKAEEKLGKDSVAASPGPPAMKKIGSGAGFRLTAGTTAIFSSIWRPEAAPRSS